MLSTLPKLADRAFIIGFLLPSLLFVVTLSALFGSLDQIKLLLKSIKEDTATLIVLGGSVWLLAVFLLTLNHWLYRCLEGYLPPLKWRKRAQVRAARRIAALRGQARRLQARLSAGGASIQERRSYREVMEALAELPAQPREALPSRFGNAIRAFEQYPREVYGADGVKLWLRVAAFAPKTLLETATEARSQVDFMVNSAFFSLVTAITLLGHIAYGLPVQAFVTAIQNHNLRTAWALVPVGDLLTLLAALAASGLFYTLAVALVPAWGDAVKASFDIGLPELATKLGFELPKTEAERRRFWVAVSQSTMYRTYPDRSPIFLAEEWLAKPNPPNWFRRLLAWLRPSIK